MNFIKKGKVKLRTKRTFLKQGTCSRTFFHIINRELGVSKPAEEAASDTLAGGIAQLGYQCGMIWGASLAAGTETFNKFKNTGKARALAIEATKAMNDSFISKARSIECNEITKVDFTKKWGLAKFFFSGKMYTCYTLASKWAPLAVDNVKNTILNGTTTENENELNCATEVVKKMEGTDEEATMVAGFAGGLGLSGNGCGALAAAIWKITLEKSKNREWKYTIPDPDSANLIEQFKKTTANEVLCAKICQRKFNNLQEHSEYIKNGGCKDIMNVLAKS